MRGDAFIMAGALERRELRASNIRLLGLVPRPASQGAVRHQCAGVILAQLSGAGPPHPAMRLFCLCVVLAERTTLRSDSLGLLKQP